MSLRVAEATSQTEDVLVLVLEHPEGRDLPRWTAGAHVDVQTPAGARQYSLCGDPADLATWRIAVLREKNSRGGSRYLHERVPTGRVIDVGLPRNNFPLVDGHLFRLLAGGIGITPLLPMVRELHGRGADWRLYYGGRSRRRMAFLDELETYADRVVLVPEDTDGLLPVDSVVAGLGQDARLYCCGPEPLLAATERAFQARGVASLHVERFSPRPPSPGAAPDRGFEVVLAGSGRVVAVGPGQSVLDALGRAGLDVPSSCREGTCASCETTVLDGEVEHRDSVLSPDERAGGATMMICVSRARSERLTLDI